MDLAPDQGAVRQPISQHPRLEFPGTIPPHLQKKHELPWWGSSHSPVLLPGQEYRRDSRGNYPLHSSMKATWSMIDVAWIAERNTL